MSAFACRGRFGPALALVAKMNLSSNRCTVSSSGSSIGNATRIREIAGDKLAHEIFGDCLAELKRETGEAPLQLGQRLRQKIRRDRRDGAELERARQHALLMFGIVKQVAHRSEDGARAARNLLALLGELDARLAALDEAQMQLVLELLDLHGERRLAHGTGLRRMAEMPRLGERFEVAQLAERDHRR
jgi:hypothetical protein